MGRESLLRRLRAIESRMHPHAPNSAGQEVLAELSQDALQAICDAYKAHGITGDKPPGPNPQLEAEVWAILLNDAPTPEVFARWEGLLKSAP